jgi:hypothetical protein
MGELAAQQERVVAIWQLIALGFGTGAIEHKLRTGELYPLFRGVYAVGCRTVSRRGWIMAATLACGPEAVASHHAAAAVHMLRPSSRSTIDVTVPGRSRRSRKGIKVHAVRSWHPDDNTVVDGIPVTSVARTFLDQAEVVQLHQLANMVAEAETRHVFDLRAVERLMERSPGRRGLKPLAKVIAGYLEPPVTKSDFEAFFLLVCADAGIPLPQTNLIIAGHRVDAVWIGERLVVELDSRKHHLTTTAFEEDRRRDADLQLAGYRVLRITWRRLREEPRAVVGLVWRMLALAQPAVR